MRDDRSSENSGLDVLVEYLRLAVCQVLEARKSRYQFLLAFDRNAELLDPLAERGAAGQLFPARSGGGPATSSARMIS